jgi:hypothetical protein
LVEKALEGKMAGNMVDAVKDAIVLALRYEREIVGLAPPESPPPSIVLFRKLQETKVLDEIYFEAFKHGVELGLKVRLNGERLS